MVTVAEVDRLWQLAVVTQRSPTNIEIVLKYGINPDKIINKSTTALLSILGNPDENTLKNVRLLIKYGANANKRLPRLLKAAQRADKENLMSPIILATAKLTDTKVLKALIDAGANINYVDFMGRSALSVAIDRGNYELVKFLLKNGANVDEIMYDKASQLYTAFRSFESKEIFRILGKYELAARKIQTRVRVNRKNARSTVKTVQAFRGKLPSGPADVIASFLYGPTSHRHRYQTVQRTRRKRNVELKNKRIKMFQETSRLRDIARARNVKLTTKRGSGRKYKSNSVLMKQLKMDKTQNQSA
jgi:hypothetical protein